MQVKRFAILLLIMVALIGLATAKKSHGVKSGTEQNGFVFLDRFAYDENPEPISQGAKRVAVGYIEAEITFRNKDDWAKVITLWEYTDAENDWPAIYPKDVPCDEKVRNSGGNTHQQLAIDQTTGKATVKLAALGGTRRRFHYMALVHCGGYGSFEYDLHFYRLSSHWSKEFGVNEAGSNTLYVIWFILYFFILAATAWNFKLFRDKQQFVHSILKLFTISVGCAFINVLCEVIHWGGYTTNGKGHPFVQAFGDICEIVATTSFLLLLLLLAQGWAISSGLHNSNLKQRNITIGFVSLFGLLKIVAFLLKLVKSNPAKTGTSDGIVVFYNFLFAFDLFFGAFYLYSLFNSIRVETNPVKNRFMKLLLAFTLYIIATAAVATISWALDPWVRDFLVSFTTVLVLTIAQCVMLYLLWFSRSAQYFELTSESPELGTGMDDLNYENF